MPFSNVKDRFEAQELYMPVVDNGLGHFDIPQIQVYSGPGPFFAAGGKPSSITLKQEKLFKISGHVRLARDDNQQLIWLNQTIQEAVYDFVLRELKIVPVQLNNQSDLDADAQHYLSSALDGPFIIMNSSSWNAARIKHFTKIEINTDELSHVGREIIESYPTDFPVYTFLNPSIEKPFLMMLGKNDAIVISDLEITQAADGGMALRFGLGCPNKRLIRVYSV